MSRRAFTAGVFDGVHIGHRRVLEALLATDPDARVLVFPRPEEDDVPLLTSVGRRVELLREPGVRRVAVHDGDAPVQPEPGEVFVTGPSAKVRSPFWVTTQPSRSFWSYSRMMICSRWVPPRARAKVM